MIIKFCCFMVTDVEEDLKELILKTKKCGGLKMDKLEQIGFEKEIPWWGEIVLYYSKDTEISIHNYAKKLTIKNFQDGEVRFTEKEFEALHSVLSKLGWFKRG